MRKTLLSCFAVLWSFVLLAASPPHPPELSADMIAYHKNKVVDEGKFYVGKDAVRLDMQKRMKQTDIIHWEADKIEVWMHEQKMIMEMKMQYNALVNYKPEGFSEVCSGEETLDGHPCQKCRMTGKFMGKTVETNVWKAKDLSGMVIRNMNDDGTGSEIKNILLGPQSASLFVAPANYKKMELPGGLGDLMKGMTH